VERKLLGTPMVAVLAAVATTDVAFAADSIPAIYAVTDDPFLVFAANAFSVLGLLAMYFVLAEIMVRFRYLRPALALILVFVGAKMALASVYHVPISLSLAVIVGVIATAVVASLLRPGPRPSGRRVPLPPVGAVDAAQGVTAGRLGRGKRPSLPPIVNRRDHGVANPFEQEHPSVEQTVREPHDQVRHDHGNGQARDHVGRVVRSDEDSSGCDERCDGDEEFPDAAVDEVDPEGESERGACVVARK
jgi:hypothetical protein